MRVTGRRPAGGSWLGEILLALLAAAIGLLFLWTTVEEYPETAELPTLGSELTAGLACGTALVLFRRRRPVGLTLVMIPFGILFATPMGATMVALFTVAVRRPWRVTVAVAAVHATAVVTVYRIGISDDRRYWESMITVVLLHVSLVAIGMLIRSQRQLLRAAQERARQAEEGQRLRVEEARHTERERLAREMHDVLAHRISLLAVHAGALEVRRDASDEERQAAGVIRQCAYDALEDLRQVIGMLRDPAEDAGDRPGGRDGPLPDGNGRRHLEDRDGRDPGGRRPQPTLAELPELIAQSRRTGAEINLDSGIADPGTVPSGLGRHTYRIVQEALTNARKHAPGAPVRIFLAGGEGRGLTVEVSNPLSAAARHDARAAATAPAGWAAPSAGTPPAERTATSASPEMAERTAPPASTEVAERTAPPASPEVAERTVTSASPAVRTAASTGKGLGKRPSAPEGRGPAGRRTARHTASADGIPGAGAGLIGLRERVALVGGSLEVRHDTGPDGRFLLRAWLPWPP